MKVLFKVKNVIWQIFILFFFLSTITTYGQKGVFLRKIEFELETISQHDYENEYFLTLQLNKDSKYSFKVLNHIGSKPGQAEVKIYDGDRLVGTNTLNEKYFDEFVFQCQKTGFYDIIITFKDDILGHSAIELFLNN